MKNKSGNGSVCELSIRGDELEHDRIQLENNLMHTDLSLHLSSGIDDYHSSVEYPRHNSGPSPFADFASFDHPSRDNFDPDNHGHLHAWSYRTMDDEEGINPYAGGETVSTAAHHASALTLTAGIAGGRVRRDVSLSGAEYDPDRPLHDMMAGVDNKFSAFGIDLSNSKHTAAASAAFDPLVVDSSTELDRVLHSGLARRPGSRSIAPRLITSSASSSASDSESSNPTRSRPKLSDALRRVSFSPKRPHSPQSHHLSPHERSHTQLPAQKSNLDRPHSPSVSISERNRVSPLNHHQTDANALTPRPHSRRNMFSSDISAQPEVRLQPPTPSSAGSQFAKVARGLAREIEAEQSRRETDVGGSKPIRQPGTRRTPMKSPRGKVHLPDVTGLTSAVESPAKPTWKHYMYRVDDGPREAEARLLSTLTAVQSKLMHLESENSISRRRVRELELELEACKREVARERTRVMEREEVIVQQQRDVDRANATRKGKSKVLETEQQTNERYREVVEEKKALEALIATLRAHLARLTAELSSHQDLLVELRSLRESDSRALKEKSLEVDKLREQVERLAGEVEVLRGVVEEGLKERRLVREQHSQSHVSGEHTIPDLLEPEVTEEEVEENDPETRESGFEDELECASPSCRSLSRSPSLDTQGRPNHDEIVEPPGSPQETDRHESDNTSPLSESSKEARDPQPSSSSRPPAPTLAQASDRNHRSSRALPVDQGLAVETPFPQIRGSHLERLFFSAPEHNAKSCAVCHRRRPPSYAQEQPTFWFPKQKRDYRPRVENAPADDDEGFVEGSEGADHEHISPSAKSKGKQRERMDFANDLSRRAEKGVLPPQTVLARVLRELEDDFTHYKGIYVELADQYKTMDAVSDVLKRNILAQHLREVIDILEQKGDQIASLYDLLTFKDKPITESVGPNQAYLWGSRKHATCA